MGDYPGLSREEQGRREFNAYLAGMDSSFLNADQHYNFNIGASGEQKKPSDLEVIAKTKSDA